MIIQELNKNYNIYKFSSLSQHLKFKDLLFGSPARFGCVPLLTPLYPGVAQRLVLLAHSHLLSVEFRHFFLDWRVIPGILPKQSTMADHF